MSPGIRHPLTTVFLVRPLLCGGELCSSPGTTSNSDEVPCAERELGAAWEESPSSPLVWELTAERSGAAMEGQNLFPHPGHQGSPRVRSCAPQPLHPNSLEPQSRVPSKAARRPLPVSPLPVSAPPPDRRPPLRNREAGLADLTPLGSRAFFFVICTFKIFSGTPIW